MSEQPDNARYQMTKRSPPEIMLQQNADWNLLCWQKVAHIPAGYTYLMQLVGHDMGHSVPSHLVPHVPRADSVADRSTRVGPEAKRVNLIANPLTLETIYGAGPRLLGHVFDPDTFLFRLHPSATVARIVSQVTPSDHMVRALYDDRNRDTLMLHELTTVWMQLHNHCARQLLANGMQAVDVYHTVRAHVLRVWHQIIREDILKRFVCKDIAELPEDTLPAVWKLDEISLQHGLFRAFHAMPLPNYRLPQSGHHPIAHLMKNKVDQSPYLASMAEDEGWFVDWDRFFGNGPDVPLTGISASVGGIGNVAQLDFATATDTGALRLGDEAMEKAVAALPPDLRAQTTPARLASDFAQEYASAPKLPTEKGLATGPLYQVLMIEAQLYGDDKKGGFGPLGSALLRASITEAIARIIMPPLHPAEADLPSFATMLTLIQHVRKDAK